MENQTTTYRNHPDAIHVVMTIAASVEKYRKFYLDSLPEDHYELACTGEWTFSRAEIDSIMNALESNTPVIFSGAIGGTIVTSFLIKRRNCVLQYDREENRIRDPRLRYRFEAECIVQMPHEENLRFLQAKPWQFRIGDISIPIQSSPVIGTLWHQLIF